MVKAPVLYPEAALLKPACLGSNPSPSATRFNNSESSIIVKCIPVPMYFGINGKSRRKRWMSH